MKNKLSAATANRVTALLRRCLEIAIQHGYLKINPSSHLKQFHEKEVHEVVLSKEECQRLIESCKQDEKPYMTTLFLLAMFTGRRVGEILNIQWNDINFETGIITLFETKAGEKQFVYLDETATSIIKNTSPVAGNSYLIAGSVTGQPVIFYRRAWERIIKRANTIHLCAIVHMQ